MSKKQIDYSKTIIYKLVCDKRKYKEIYIGHATNVYKRMNNYQQTSKNGDTKLYKYIRETGGFQNWTMIDLEEFPCKNKQEADERVKYYINLLDAKLNSCIPSRTLLEYTGDKKQYIQLRKKQYRENNKEHIQQYEKQYKQLF